MPLSTQLFKSKISKLSLVLLHPLLNRSRDSKAFLNVSLCLFVSTRSGVPDSLLYIFHSQCLIDCDCLGINLYLCKQWQPKFFLGAFQVTGLVRYIYHHLNFFFSRSAIIVEVNGRWRKLKAKKQTSKFDMKLYHRNPIYGTIFYRLNKYKILKKIFDIVYLILNSKYLYIKNHIYFI